MSKRIGMIGTGYVGLVNGVGLADFGNIVTCTDIDSNKIAMLKNGEIPIYEPGLQEYFERNVKMGRLSFSDDIDQTIQQNEIIFIAVNTPFVENKGTDLSYVENVGRRIAKNLNDYKVIVTKSTVPVGTNRWLKELIAQESGHTNFDVVSNPEFLREGSAVYDFTHPDRVVIGAETLRAFERMKQVYRVLYLNETPFIETNLETAEMIKYASNAFLAMKITFINEIANLCEKVGADVQDVAKAMGRDGRIGPKFLHPGPGFGGSCFPKDTMALAKIGREYGAPVTLIEQTIKANEAQKMLMVAKIREGLGSLVGKQLAILGLAFKPNTDDMREAPVLVILNELAKQGMRFKVYDPKAMEEAKWRLANLKDQITYCQSEYEAIDGCDALVILTEWNQFRSLDLPRVKKLLKEPYFFDLRNIYKREMMEEAGFYYFGVGQGKKGDCRERQKEAAASKE